MYSKLNQQIFDKNRGKTTSDILIDEFLSSTMNEP